MVVFVFSRMHRQTHLPNRDVLKHRGRGCDVLFVLNRMYSRQNVECRSSDVLVMRWQMKHR